MSLRSFFTGRHGSRRIHLARLVLPERTEGPLVGADKFLEDYPVVLREIVRTKVAGGGWQGRGQGIGAVKENTAREQRGKELVCL